MSYDHHLFLIASFLSSREKVKVMLCPVGKTQGRNPQNYRTPTYASKNQAKFQLFWKLWFSPPGLYSTETFRKRRPSSGEELVLLEQDSPRSINSREKQSRNLLVPTFVFQCCSVGVGGGGRGQGCAICPIIAKLFFKSSGFKLFALGWHLHPSLKEFIYANKLVAGFPLQQLLCRHPWLGLSSRYFAPLFRRSEAIAVASPCKQDLNLLSALPQSQNNLGLEGPSGDHPPQSKANFRGAAGCSGPGWNLNISKDGDPTACLGSLCQSLTSLTMKDFSLYLIWLSLAATYAFALSLYLLIFCCAPQRRAHSSSSVSPSRQLRTAMRCPPLYSAAPWTSMLSGRQRTCKHRCFANRHPRKVRTISHLKYRQTTSKYLKLPKSPV